ncbi:hypothetical protein ABZV77_23315 [Streptomyces sp. NPDC004732]|uniref:hypothetical protein n=1 Tax=Streptomyces sp. NPDC004732 TaxID=3154290 RepID=UPI0033BA3812
MTHPYGTREHDDQELDTCDVLLSSHDVRDDGLIVLHVLGPTRGVPATAWTHDPERLRRLLREHKGPAQWQPRGNRLRLSRATVGTTLVRVAEPPRR